MLSEEDLSVVAARLAGIGGVAGVMLGGSRGRGEGRPDSDTDLGLYYRDAIDIEALAALARELGGPDAEVTQHGGWGPWVDGGGWLTIDGAAVDLIYRDIDRVEDCWRRVVAGEHAFGVQAGHPLGVPLLAYPGEVALGRVLADPTGVLTSLKQRFSAYPPALAEAVVGGLWEARFLVGGAAKVVGRRDSAYLALLLTRALLLAAHALCARNGRWVTNEKGLVAIAAGQPGAPDGFAETVETVLATVTTDPGAAVALASSAVEQVAAATERRGA